MKYYKVIFISALVVFVLCAILCIGFALKGEVFLNINENNREIILEKCEMNSIIIEEGISRIGCKQGLGDWYLFLGYENGVVHKQLLNDTVAIDLQTYIRENGQVGLLVLIFVNVAKKCNGYKDLVMKNCYDD